MSIYILMCVKGKREEYFAARVVARTLREARRRARKRNPGTMLRDWVPFHDNHE